MRRERDKMLLIMNPGSRSGRGKRLWRLWESGLKKAGAAFDLARTEGLGHAFELARAARSYDVVVAVGGDGTISEVLDGVVASGSAQLQMGVLYSGTSPDFCRFHDVPTDPQRAIDLLVSGESRKVDVARITYTDQDGAERTAHFGCSCNIGMGAAVARYSNRWRRFAGDTLGTATAVLRALALNARPDLELEIDGEAHRLSRVNNLSVAKNPYLASGLKLALDVAPDDGRLWLVGVHGKGRAGMCAVLPRFYSGSVTAAPGVFLERCSCVTVRSRERTEIEFDGDPRGFLPARIEILPKALNLICPGGLREPGAREASGTRSQNENVEDAISRAREKENQTNVPSVHLQLSTRTVTP